MARRIWTRLVVRAGILLAWMQAMSAEAVELQVVDDFSDSSRWTIAASEGVELTKVEERPPNADAAHASTLQLDINFRSGGGYAGIRRELPLDLPANFEIAFSLRGHLPRNNLEFKLVDQSGENVWWVNRRNFHFPQQWTKLASRRRHFEFAWGPSRAAIKRARWIEIVIASAEGGRGTIYLDDLTFRPLPEPTDYKGTPIVSASSEDRPMSAPQFVLDGNKDSAWRSALGDAKPTLTIDFGTLRELGGLIVDWESNAYPRRYDVQLSDDAENWEQVRTVDAANEGPQFISLPDTETRAVRLVMETSAQIDYVAAREIEVLPLQASRNENEFAAVVARRSPRGHFPRAILGEGTFWTVVGSPESDREALISEDGAVEVDRQRFTIEPFVATHNRLLSWADAKTTQSLAEGHAPVPTVLRNHDGLEMSITAAADGRDESSALFLLYTLANKTRERATGELFLAVRPFQVNPPYQWLNTPGGVTRINRIASDESGRMIEVDDKVIAFGQAPEKFGAATFDEGQLTTYLAEGSTPPHTDINDPQHSASAATGYHFDLEPGASRRWTICVPFSQGGDEAKQIAQSLLNADDPVEFVRQRQQTAVMNWRRATSTFELLVPPEASDIENVIRSTLAYILINRDGPGIQPGSRSYERSWIRDGSLTAAALLRFGLEREAREFVDWYARYQFDSGKIPCVVDRRGPDPVPENDSHGQFIMAVMNLYRFGADKEVLREHWPRVQKAVAYIEGVRGQRMTAEYGDPNTTATRQEPNKPAVSLHAFYGLMPESISHEGYSAKPMHSYWDNFFTLRGLKDAAAMARILGNEADAARYQKLADDFADTLYTSIELAMQTHQIDYIPGCVELGDFDATSTTVALWPCGEMGRLPRPALDRTFDLYWERFLKRRNDPKFEWTEYTPYELRCVGSMVLLGLPSRAQEALEFFMNDRLPKNWNQWPEVVHRDPRTARFIGDMPHTWCGSDFLNSVRMMFLYERETDNSLILLAGVPKPWFGPRMIGFKNMPTYGGRLSCIIDQANGERFTAHIEGSCPVPSSGIRLTIPIDLNAEVAVNGAPGEMDGDGRLLVRTLPATIEVHAPRTKVPQ
jgi:hypothetical protein